MCKVVPGLDLPHITGWFWGTFGNGVQPPKQNLHFPGWILFQAAPVWYGPPVLELKGWITGGVASLIGSWSVFQLPFLVREGVGNWKKLPCSWVFCKIKMASISLCRFKFIRSKSSHGVFVQRNILRAELKLNFVGDSGLRLRYEWWSTTSSVSQQITGKSYRLKGAFDRIC